MEYPSEFMFHYIFTGQSQFCTLHKKTNEGMENHWSYKSKLQSICSWREIIFNWIHVTCCMVWSWKLRQLSILMGHMRRMWEWEFLAFWIPTWSLSKVVVVGSWKVKFLNKSQHHDLLSSIIVHWRVHNNMFMFIICHNTLFSI